MRRTLLGAVLLLAALLPAPLATAEPPAAVADPVDCLRSLAGLDLQHATVLDLQRALTDGRITSRQLVERYLERIAAFDAAGPAVNGIRELHPDPLGQADALDVERRAGVVRGPLHGIPVLLKDNIGTADMPTTAGSVALEGAIPDRDAFLVQRLRDAGAIILGKAELAEFANWVDLRMPNGYSSLGGQVLNSYDLARNPSGSSSGSATSAAMAFAAVVFGSETSGSILSPAEVQGLAAVKPTVGLISRTGVIPLAPSWDTTGPMVRSITDAAAALTATVGVDAEDPRSLESRPHLPPTGDYMPFLRTDALEGVRLGVQGRDSAGAVLQAAYDELERQGATLVDIEQLDELGTIGAAELGAVPNEFKAGLDAYLASEVDPPSGVESLAEIALFAQQHADAYPYGSSLLLASAAQPGLAPTTVPGSVAITEASQAVIDQTLARYDLTAIVSGGTQTFRIGASAGYPTVAVPAGSTREGRSPVNLAFLGTAWTEPQLLAMAYDYEQATLHRVPPTEVNADQLATPACDAGSAAASSGTGPGSVPAAATVNRVHVRQLAP